ncbi:MAG: hypothetical protein ACOYK7_15865, partial [Pirellulales bacterium]
MGIGHPRVGDDLPGGGQARVVDVADVCHAHVGPLHEPLEVAAAHPTTADQGDREPPVAVGCSRDLGR